MLSSNSSAPPPQQTEPSPSSQPRATRLLRGSSNHSDSIPDGYASPRRQLEKQQRLDHLPTSPPPVRPSQHQQHLQHKHVLSAPHPILSPSTEYHSGFTDEDAGFPHASIHRRQQSFPNLLPYSFRSRTPSPTRKQTPLSVEMPLTGDGRGGNGRVDSRGGLAGWLSGTAAASALGINVSREVTPDTTPTRLRRGVTASPSTAGPSSVPRTNNVTTTASRFISAISSRFAQTPTSHTLDDELYNLNVEAALFPPGSPTADRDPFSPAAFKNLQANATGLLIKLQNAYRERVVTIQELQAEKSAQREELEEAETRAQHLKMQLEGMAQKAQEQEKAMQQLVEELGAQRKARVEMEERFAREKALASGSITITNMSSEGSMVSEDLGVDDDDLRRQKWRKSGSSRSTVDDTDEEEEQSVESESIFSRSRSPTLPAHPTSSVNSSLAPPKPRNSTQQMSAFQKIFKGISGENDQESSANGCRNCKGKDASVAWDTVSLLRDENKHLKHRVAQLEVAVEGALDFVNGIGL
ncbi:hypothetical protein QBC46DRAFT_288544 [Diplogelasinospora grovesii]|uniref:Uncharacterized protein n=1 Tax=Diplogelasinospora grovesii TaxID=303347 RepID=A0AAN6N7P7_9PEZI|nr:hypothetical protein QBC46DRAFT_288544 [Diplogelasinospora grovesii]